MKKLADYSLEELRVFEEHAKNEYNKYLNEGVSINMARGKPAAEQLDLSDELMDLTKEQVGFFSEDGTDCRNYGVLFGLDETRKLFGEMLGVDASKVIACGNSSLNLMYDYISQCCSHGVAGNEPWLFNKNRKFIALVPGYDRHFAIAERFGLQLISVPMTATGPDMDKVEEIIKDPDVKGMFCVPKYSNPDGITYSDETVERLAAMKPAAKDFRVIWDAAYIIHDLYDEHDELKNVLETAEKYGNEDNFVMFASTSKITYAGAGVAVMAASDRNIKEIASRLTIQIISYDKINQLKHAYIFKTLDDVRAKMKQHADILRPKFDAVLEVLDEQLSGLGIAQWNSPRGGYFISLDCVTGSAKYVGQLCKECGLTLTNVGATHPYGIDPDDQNIRIAPSCPTVDELKVATNILCAAVKLAACKELLSGK